HRLNVDGGGALVGVGFAESANRFLASDAQGRFVGRANRDAAAASVNGNARVGSDRHRVEVDRKGIGFAELAQVNMKLARELLDSHDNADHHHEADDQKNFAGCDPTSAAALALRACPFVKFCGSPKKDRKSTR